MATITHYYCPVCKSEIEGIGWKEGKMKNCPKCGAFINNLNQVHLKVFVENIAICIVGLLFSILLTVLSAINVISEQGVLFFGLIDIAFVVLLFILFIRRETAKQNS